MSEQEDRERYRKSPTYGTNFSKPVSVLIEDIRKELTTARGHVTDIMHGSGWEDRVKHIEGLLTCGLVALYTAKEEISKSEIKNDYKKYGKSIRFNSRGIGLESGLCCFVCETKHRSKGSNEYLNNISAFVQSKEEGEEIVSWFTQGAKLDFRPSEPEWIQVKIGACDNHLPNLQSLHDVTSVHGVIRKAAISNAIMLPLII